MTQLALYISDPITNPLPPPIFPPGLGAWTEVIGLSEVTFTRTGQSQPGLLDCSVNADLEDSGTDPYKRFYPFLNIMLAVKDATNFSPINTVLFIGRIDHAELQEASIGTPRHWHIVARDWLAVLADNYIGPGTWRSVALDPINRGGLAPDHGTTWDGSYIDDYANRHLGVETAPPAQYGEYRGFIIEDLCLNIVDNVDAAGNPLGLLGVSLALAPNSKPINISFADKSQITILDAIITLANSDPWDTGSPGAFKDGVDIAVASFPASAGFGGELQIMPFSQEPSGRHVQYHKRGAYSSGSIYSYQNNLPVIFNNAPIPATGYICDYQFAHEGSDIFSRVKPTGSGDATYNIVSGEGQARGIVFPPMEGFWSPAAGQFRVRRESTNRSQAGVGFWGYITSHTGIGGDGAEKPLVQSREMSDRSYADLVSGAAALSNTRGGLNNGTITVVGPPLCPSVGTGNILIPGYTCTINIPQLGLTAVQVGTFETPPNSAGVTFTMDKIQYKWPEDKTTLTLSRVRFNDLRQQLLSWMQRVDDSVSGHTNIWVSPWESVDGTGQKQWKHNIGVHGAQVKIEAAYWNGTSVDNAGSPLPTMNTNVEVPDSYWDPAQGQNAGKYVSQIDQQWLTVFFNKWLAYSGGQGTWLTHDDIAHTIIRAKVWAS